MEQYKITGKTHWRNLWTIFYYLLLMIGVMFCIYYINGIENLPLFIEVMFIGFLSQLLPQLALHLNYYSVNKGDTLVYDKVYQEVTFVHDNKEVKFSLEDVASVTMYKSFALQKGNIQFLTYDSYYHAIIVLKNSTRIVLTSLLFGKEKFPIPIPEEKIRVKMNLYRWARGPSLQN
jgi:hypothetical protein